MNTFTNKTHKGTDIQNQNPTSTPTLNPGMVKNKINKTIAWVHLCLHLKSKIKYNQTLYEVPNIQNHRSRQNSKGLHIFHAFLGSSSHWIRFNSFNHCLCDGGNSHFQFCKIHFLPAVLASNVKYFYSLHPKFLPESIYSGQGGSWYFSKLYSKLY